MSISNYTSEIKEKTDTFTHKPKKTKKKSSVGIDLNNLDNQQLAQLLTALQQQGKTGTND